MSQLRDIEEAVLDTPLKPEQRGKLFFDLLQALGWEVEGIQRPEDATVYLQFKDFR